MPQVAAVRTRLSQGQALGALLAAGCPTTALLMAGAQSAVETAGWQSMYAYNFGNITAGSPATQTWTYQGSNAIRFLVYPDAVSGARDFIVALEERGLLAHAAANDLAGYVAQLRASCYLGCIGRVDANGTTVSQTDYDNYQAGIAAWMARLRNVAPVPPPPPPSRRRGWVLPLSLLLVGGAAAYAVHSGAIRVPRRSLAA